MINRIQTWFKQFPSFFAIKYLLFQIARKILNPNCFDSYSQTGEDRIIETFTTFKLEVETGYYVDVGCHHPFLFSNTFRLYRSGWRGLNIDANEKMIELFRKYRPRDESVCAAVSNTQEEKTFTYSKNIEMSTLSSEFKKNRIDPSDITNEIRVKTETLHFLFQKYQVPNNFELLAIDVEGHDYEVLTSFDINQFRPKLIIIEMHDFDIENTGKSKIFSYLKEKGYRLLGYVTMNGYFIDIAFRKP